MEHLTIRNEKQSDQPAIFSLHCGAFPSSAEANLVDQLRNDGDLVLSLVAIHGDALVAHVALSRMKAPFAALGLGPVAVRAAERRQGVAHQLISKALDQARDQQWFGVFVLGDPHYYQRLGFSLDAAAGFGSPYSGPHFLGRALQGSNLPTTAGTLAYAKAFNALG